MPRTSSRSTDEAAIFARLWDSEEQRLPMPLAKHILRLKFSADDQARMHDLAERNRSNRLTPSEQRELDSFIKVGDLLAILQSRTRRRLKSRHG
jgi:hypothetical protein